MRQFVRIPLYWDGTAPERWPASWQPGEPRATPTTTGTTATKTSTRAVRAGLTPVLQVDGAPTWAQRCQTPAVLLEPRSAIPTRRRWRPSRPRPRAATAARFPGLPRVQLLAGAQRAQPQPLLLPPVRHRAARPLSPESVPRPDQRLLLGGQGRRPLQPRARRRPRARSRCRSGRSDRCASPGRLLCMTGTKQPRPTPGDCGGGVHFDIFAIQPYTTGGPTHKGGRQRRPARQTSPSCRRC